MSESEEYVCPDCEAHDVLAESLSEALIDRFEEWIALQPEQGAPAAAIVDGCATVTAGMLMAIDVTEDRDDVAVLALLVILENSGCDVGKVLAVVRENMAEHLTPAGNA